MYNLIVFYQAKDKTTVQQFYDELKASGAIDASRNEEGNIRYDYFFSAERENELLLVEQWKNREAQKYHSTLPHFAAIGALKAKYQIETSFEEI